MAEGDVLMPEVLKLLIAVICIVLLVILAFNLYGIITKKTAVEQAMDSINRLDSELQKIDELNNKSSVFIESPNDWQVRAWPNKNSDKKPNQCQKQYCVCICPTPSLIGLSLAVERALTECNTIGVCKDVSKPVKTLDEFGENPLEIQGPLELNISLENGEILIKGKNK